VPGTGTVAFKYDPFGRRIQKSSPLGTTNYLYDGTNPVETIDQNGNVLARYTQGRGVDEPLSELFSSTTSYYDSDGLGSITSLSNSAGVVANTYTYDSFGKLTALTGTLANPIRYTGRELDAETGIYYYRARFYDPGVGRFLSEDRIGNDEGSNLYPYVRNAPTQFRDPTGLYTLQGFDDPQLAQQMRNAIQSAIDTLQRKQKDCKDGCAGPWGPRIIQALQSANFVYKPNLQSIIPGRGEVCANGRPLNSKTINVGSAAFGPACCRLDSTLAHEATHKVAGADEATPLSVEDKCFGCH
jgi:RHS repeat-associated protein